MLDRVLLVFILGLVWAAAVTEATETPCNDEDALYAIFTDTSQILTASAAPNAVRKQVHARKDKVDFDNLASLPDKYLFYLRKANSGLCYIVPKLYDDLVLEFSKSGKVTLNTRKPKVRDHQSFEVKVNQEFGAKPLAQCLSFDSVRSNFVGFKLTTEYLDKKKSAIAVRTPSGVPDDPKQSYNIIRVN